METSKYPFFLQFSMRLLSIVLIILLAYLGEGIFKPLAFAGIFTLGLIGPCSWLERHGFNRSWAAATCVLVGLILIGLVVSFLSTQIAGFKEDIPHLKQQFNMAITQLEQFLNQRYGMKKTQMMDYVKQGEEHLLSSSGTLLGSTVATFTTILLFTVLIPIYTFLMLIYRSQVATFLRMIFEEKFHDRIVLIMSNTKNVIRSYVGGLVIEMIVVAGINCIAMSILGIKYAILLGILAAIMNVIPYIGIFTAMAISGLITLSTNGPSEALITIIILIGVHLLDSNILLPKIVGSKVKLNALVTILVVIVGEHIWGIPGMFLSVPITAILKVIFDDSFSMKHWGVLLGEEEHTKPSLSRFKKTSKNKK
ncbi:MAG: AI-2E family transporter [Pseudopedobacter saltans]|uniref:AI-2E family transporter n=1 Tax=Pseudopedobacter saltans TaxID=151895 RepID=A0A2W5H8N6_9SPHI|nr:MAG: AI-2E family transporter [Pseudopedobacter saltans]